MKKLLLLSISLLLLCGTTIAQTSLSGKITDTSTGEPVLFASVALYKNDVFLTGTESDFDGHYNFAKLDTGYYKLEVSFAGMTTVRIEDIILTAGKVTTVDVDMQEEQLNLETVVIKAYSIPRVEQDNTTTGSSLTSDQIRNLPTRYINAIATSTSGTTSSTTQQRATVQSTRTQSSTYYIDGIRVQGKVSASNEESEFSKRIENRFQRAKQERHSTFSIDVDRAAYSIVRNYLRQDQMPPAEAIRTEEMVNYFDYDYPAPDKQHPFGVHSELGICPWNPDHLLLSVALQGSTQSEQSSTGSNLTFLIDMSGSMNQENKLPLVKSSLRYLVEQLPDTDKVAIVVYAGAAGLVLPPTSIESKEAILAAIDRLESGGSTAGAAGIQLAYQTARSHYRVGGNNRVILCTDGDFNVGISNPDALEELISQEKETGIYLTALGFGMGNLKDNRLERLANKGNGIYAYVDTQKEAEKIFGVELQASLFTIAKDVKIQLRFNNKQIDSYRLIGYETRLLNKEDFEDDTKDAGEIGAGHSVTALYELIPANSMDTSIKVGELSLRYKKPDARRSQLLKHNLASQVEDFMDCTDNYRWAAAVTAYSLLLQSSPYAGVASFDLVEQLAESALGADEHGWRKAFIEQIATTRAIRQQLEDN